MSRPAIAAAGYSVGEVVRHEQYEPGDRLTGLGEPQFEQVAHRRRHLGVRFPDRVRLRQVGAGAADRRPDRPRVRDGHGDGVDPRDARHLQTLGEADDGLGEGVPREIGLVAGEQHERLPERVVRE